MRTPLIAGNWKMNLNLKDAEALGKAVSEAAEKYSDRDVLIYPTFLQFVPVSKVAGGSKVALGMQNCSAEKDGAFTGRFPHHRPKTPVRNISSLAILNAAMYSKRRMHF